MAPWRRLAGARSSYTFDVDHRVAKAVRLMQESLGSKLRFVGLARSLGLSERHFRRLFHQAMGLAPRAYWKQIRLEAARQLLGRLELEVKQVAAQVSWEDASHFVREFRRAYGVSPSRLRRKRKQVRDQASPRHMRGPGG